MKLDFFYTLSPPSLLHGFEIFLYKIKQDRPIRNLPPIAIPTTKSNFNGSYQKMVVKCHFATLNSVLAPMNSIFTPMVDVKIGCHFNNSMFFIKKYN